MTLMAFVACNSSGQGYEPNLDDTDEIPGDQVADTTPGENTILVFVVDQKAYYPDGLRIAQPDACSYIHVHGPEIFAVIPDAQLKVAHEEDYEPPSRTEDEGECGYGPPNFYEIPDTDSDGANLRNPF